MTDLESLRELYVLAFGPDCPALPGIDAAISSNDADYIAAALPFYRRAYDRAEGPLMAWLRDRALALVEHSALELGVSVEVADADPVRGSTDRPHARAVTAMLLDVPEVARVTVNPALLRGPAHVVEARIRAVLEHVRRALVAGTDDRETVLARARGEMRQAMHAAMAEQAAVEAQQAAEREPPPLNLAERPRPPLILVPEAS